MSGKIIPIISGKMRAFPGIRPLPIFWPFIVNLRTLMALEGVSFSMLMYYSMHIMRLKVHWKWNVPPSWTKWVLTNFCHALQYVILLKVVPCPLPFCFRRDLKEYIADSLHFRKCKIEAKREREIKTER